MKKLYAFSLLTLGVFAPAAHAGVEFWNSNLVWGGQGMCSAEFTFDSGGEAITKLDISFNLQNKSGKVVARDKIHVSSFGDSGASRYGQAFVESPQVCDSSVKLLVTRASAMIGGKQVDLLKTRQISARKFVPISIKVP